MGGAALLAACLAMTPALAQPSPSAGQTSAEGNPSIDRDRLDRRDPLLPRQAPVTPPAGQSAIQVLYNFQVLVSVAPPRGQANLMVESASIGRDADGNPAPVLVVHNDSATHAYVSRGTLSLVERDASGAAIFERTLAPSEIQQTIGYGLVGPGQRRSLVLPVSLPSGTGSLEARFLPATR